jgi:hypothetical protein
MDPDVKGWPQMPPKGSQTRNHPYPHPDRAVSIPPKVPQPQTSWWLCRPEQFYATAKAEQLRMTPTLWNTVIAKEKPE